MGLTLRHEHELEIKVFQMMRLPIAGIVGGEIAQKMILLADEEAVVVGWGYHLNYLSVYRLYVDTQTWLCLWTVSSCRLYPDPRLGLGQGQLQCRPQGHVQIPKTTTKKTISSLLLERSDVV